MYNGVTHIIDDCIFTMSASEITLSDKGKSFRTSHNKTLQYNPWIISW